MTEQTQFLGTIIDLLRKSGIAHMLVGSLASAIHGEPRATYDVDLVIAPSADQLEAFLTAAAPQFYVSPEAARDALARKSMFNVIDPSAGFKADLIIRGDGAFDAEEFRRRMPGTVEQVQITVATAEDTILAKLSWGKDSGSQRQFRDALSVAVAQWGKLDMAYLDRWAHALDIVELWNQTRQDAAKIKGPPPA